MLLDAALSSLVLVDLQARLMPVIEDGPAVAGRCAVLARAARLLDVPVVATEQYPKGLGGTIDQVAPLVDRTVAKLSFDASAEPGLTDALDPVRRTLVVAGCEAHVCVLQTALGLRSGGFAVVVVADAVGSRRAADRAAALARLERSGVGIVTSEMVLFEWLRRSDHPRFKDVHALIR